MFDQERKFLPKLPEPKPEDEWNRLLDLGGRDCLLQLARDHLDKWNYEESLDIVVA